MVSRLISPGRTLHESVAYTLDDQAVAGLKKFFDAAADLQIVPSDGAILYFE